MLMTFEYVDIHSHLYFPDFDKDREEEIEKMQNEKIATIVIGTDYDSSCASLALAEKYQNIFACVGQHPGELTHDSVYDERLEQLADNKNVVAIGECGLDYFRMKGDEADLKMIQKTIFEYHIDLALTLDLPLMLHIRSSKGTQDAYNDALDILEHHAKINGDKLRGNAHFFAGDLNTLRRLQEIGFTVSFTGVITFTNDYDELIKTAPLEMIMAETDAPFVAPVPHRGKRSSPVHVKEVVKKIAEIRNESETAVKIALIHNTLKQFSKIKDSIAS